MIEYVMRVHTDIDSKKYSDTCPICCVEYIEPDEIPVAMIDDREKCKPLTILCCSQQICTSCIANHIKRSGVLTCPYCRHDHRPDDLERENNQITENSIDTRIIEEEDTDREELISAISVAHHNHNPQGLADRVMEILRAEMFPDTLDENNPVLAERGIESIIEQDDIQRLIYTVPSTVDVDFSDLSDNEDEDGGYHPPTTAEVIRASRRSDARNRMADSVNRFREFMNRNRNNDNSSGIRNRASSLQVPTDDEGYDRVAVNHYDSQNPTTVSSNADADATTITLVGVPTNITGLPSPSDASNINPGRRESLLRLWEEEQRRGHGDNNDHV